MLRLHTTWLLSVLAVGLPSCGTKLKTEKVILFPSIVLRKAASARSQSLRKIPFGANVVMLGRDRDEHGSARRGYFFGLRGDWRRVRYASQAGWVFGPFLSGSGKHAKLLVYQGLAVSDQDRLAVTKTAQLLQTLVAKAGTAGTAEVTVMANCPTNRDSRLGSPHCGTFKFSRSDADSTRATLDLGGLWNAHDTWRIKSTSAWSPRKPLLKAQRISRVNRYQGCDPEDLPPPAKRTAKQIEYCSGIERARVTILIKDLNRKCSSGKHAGKLHATIVWG